MRYDWTIESALGSVAMRCCQTLAYRAFDALRHAWNGAEGYQGTLLYCNGVLVTRDWPGGG